MTPLVRKLAAEHGVDLAGLRGTGVGGRIRKQDVLEAAKAHRRRHRPRRRRPRPQRRRPGGQPAPASPSPLRGTTEKMSRLRKVIATRMVESLQVSAQLTTVVEVDLTRVARLRERAKRDFEAREGVKLSYLPFLAKATVEALKAHPRLNASIDTEAGEITYFDAEHLGVAVDTERGLLVPVVKDAGDLNIAGLARKIADLADRTREQQDRPGRARRRHLHADQHRQPRRALRHPDHQPAAGRHPRHRRGRQARGRRRRPGPRRDDRDPVDVLPRAVRTTTGWSTAPTPRGSSPRSRPGSRRARSSPTSASDVQQA